MKTSYFYHALALILLAATVPSSAQVEDDNSASAMKKMSADPSLTSNFAEKPQVTLVSSEKDSVVTASFALELENELVFGIKLQSPIEKGQEEVELANLDGLAGSSVATVSIEKLLWKEPDHPGALINSCLEYNQSLLKGDKGTNNILSSCIPDNLPDEAEYCSLTTEPGVTAEDTANPLITAYNTACYVAAHEVCTEYNKTSQGDPFLHPQQAVYVDGQGIPRVKSQPLRAYRAICSAKAIADLDGELKVDERIWIKKWKKKVAAFLPDICRKHGAPVPKDWIDLSTGCSLTVLEKKGKDWWQKGREAIGLHRPVILSLSASASTKTFKFFDAETLEKEKENKEGFAVTAAAGFLTLGGTYYGASYRRERSYKASPSTEICRPFEEGSDALRCDQGALGGPNQKDRDLVQIEARKYLSRHVGGTLRVTRDFEDDVLGYQFLLYFLQSKEKGLNGGLDFGYRDDTDNFTLRAFIGTGFNLLSGS